MICSSLGTLCFKDGTLSMSFFLNSISFFAPIPMGTMPSSPMMYLEQLNEINEPSALVATNKPIPIY